MKITRFHLFTLLFSVSLPFWFPYLPTGLPPHQGKAVALGLMAFFLWITESIPLFTTSLLILFFSIVVVLPSFKEVGITASPSQFLDPFASNIIFLFFGGLLLAEAIGKYGLDKWLAKKATYIFKTPSTLLFGMMGVTAFLSMWMSNTAATAMMMIVAAPIVSSLGEKSPFARAFFLGIPFSANLGGMGTPVGTPPNAIAIEAINKFGGVHISFLDWMLASAPLLLISLAFLYFILTKTFDIPKEGLCDLPPITIRFDRATISVLIVFGLTVLLWLSSKWHGISIGMVALVPPIIFFSLGILETSDLKRISWEVLYLVGGGITLSMVLRLSGVVGDLVGSFSFSSIQEIWIIAIFSLLGSLMTSFMSRTATASIVVPMVFLIPNIPPIPVALGTTMVISGSMVLPISTPPNAIAYSSGLVDLKDMVKIGLIITVFTLISFVFLGPLWWKMVGII